MFFLIPWSVDVPRERQPYMNWLIIQVIITVFMLQMSDPTEYQGHQSPSIRNVSAPDSCEIKNSRDHRYFRSEWLEYQGITGAYVPSWGDFTLAWEYVVSFNLWTCRLCEDR